MDKVTAVLITRESSYPKEIEIKGFNEVIIVPHSPSVFERYMRANSAVNDIIYVQDDDCIVDYRELWNHYNGTLTNAMTEHHVETYKGTGATLVGWGCFFPKSALSVFHKYMDKYGLDNHLYREADRIFTVLNQPHNTVIMPHVDINQHNRMSHEPDHYESAKQAIAKATTLL